MAYLIHLRGVFLLTPWGFTQFEGYFSFLTLHFKLKTVFILISYISVALILHASYNVIAEAMVFLKTLIEKNRRELFLALIAVMGLILFIPVFTYAYFAKDLKSPEGIMNRNNTGVVLFDRNNEIFFKFYEGKYERFVPLSDIPPRMQQALIVAEDKNYYDHPGFSVKSILAAFVANIKKGDIAYGGSTITQQLVKTTLLASQKSFLRKYQELVLAEEIERKYTKDEILTMYFNSVYFGEGAFGIEEAAKTYFNISAKNLSLAQSAILAALPTAPSKLSPISGDREKVIERSRYILGKMAEEHYITNEQKEVAIHEKLAFNTDGNKDRYKAPHFALMVKDELIKKYGEEEIARSGFKVYTTIDLGWQKYAEEIVAKQVEALKFSRVSNGAAVVIDAKTGEIRVVVGSKDWNNDIFGKLNIVTAARQPGSAFKPIVYSAALEKGIITLATILKDEPITYKNAWETYSPRDYDGKFRGRVTARRALANSLNIPSVEVISKLGVDNAVEMGKRLGLTTLKDYSQYGLSLVLGAAEVRPLDLTEVYATFANGGVRNTSTTIAKIENKIGELVYVHIPEKQQVLDPKYAFLVSSILSDNNARSEVFGNILNISRPAAVKTGTTENYKDSWTVGYTPSLVIGVWIGNNDGTVMERIAGSIGAAPIWKALMEKFLAGTPIEQFVAPAGIVSESICRENGLRVKGATASAQLEYFVGGTEPTQYCYTGIPTSVPSGNPSVTTAPPASSSPTAPQTPSRTNTQPSPTPLIDIKLPPGKSKKE